MKRNYKGSKKVLRDRLAVHPKTSVVVLELLQGSPQQQAHLMRLVQTDPALAAAVMRAANSVHLGFARKIGGLRQATVMLGQNLVNAVVAGRVADRVFERKPMEYPEWLWAHSMALGAACTVLARRTGVSPDEANTAGLLHDIGWLMAASNHVELEGRDRSHARVGAGLLTRWNLPERLVQAVEHHHSIVDSSVSPLAKLVIAGHAFTEELGANGPEPAVSVIEALHMLRLDVRPATVIDEIEEELVTITNVLELVR